MNALKTLVIVLAVSLVVSGPGFNAAPQANDSHQDHEDHDYEPGEHPVDPVNEVQAMIKNGRLDEAAVLLHGLEGDEYVLKSLLGLLEMKRGKPEKAIAHFKRVLELKPNQTAVWLYLGEAYFEAQQYQDAVDALRSGKSAGDSLPSYFRLLAQAELAAGLTEDGYQTLLDGAARFPAASELQLDRALFLIEAGLYTAALEAAEGYLATRPTDANGHAVMAEALRSAGRPLKAAAVLENALLQEPGNTDLLARLGLCYSAAQKPLAAARSFYRAAALSGRFHYETAEQFRLAGKIRRALLHNSAVSDEKRRLRQRLTILLAGERFDRASALHESIEKTNAWDDNTRFLLAHAHIRTGAFRQAKMLYAEIEDTALRKSAAKMMETIASMEKARPVPVP